MTGIDKDKVRISFNHAAPFYAQTARIQHNIHVRLSGLTSLYQATDTPAPVSILDLGCGSCPCTTELASQFQKYHIIGLDFSEAMLREIPISDEAENKTNYVCGDFESIPFAASTFDLIYSSSALQWADNLIHSLHECKRCLRAGGYLFIAIYGHATLRELSSSWHAIDQYKHTLEFISMRMLVRLLEDCGFNVILNHRQFEIALYDSVRALLRTLHQTGIKNWRTDRRHSLTPPSQLKAMETRYYSRYAHGNKIPATYEVLFIVAKNIN